MNTDPGLERLGRFWDRQGRGGLQPSKEMPANLVTRVG